MSTKKIECLIGLCFIWILSNTIFTKQIFGQYNNIDIWYNSLNPKETAIKIKYNDSISTICAVNSYLISNGIKLNNVCEKKTYSLKSFDDLAGTCAFYSRQNYVLPYKDSILRIVKTQKKINFCDYDNATLITLIDNKRLYKDSIKTQGCNTSHVIAKTKEGYTRTTYPSLLREITDMDNPNSLITGFNQYDSEDKISYHSLYQFAQEIIFLNNNELNRKFWEAFGCKREIKVTFCKSNFGPIDTAYVSIAFIFGAAYANYFHDPLFYNLISNPYSVSLVNGVPFDPVTYKDFIPLMEKYIRYISCQNINIPFLIKMNHKPLVADEGYSHFPLPDKYYSLPEKCSGKKSEDFPLNFCPTVFYKTE